MVIIILFCLGFLSSFSLPPYNFFLINFFTFPVLFYILVINISRNLLNNFLVGWFYGFGYFLSNLYWISNSLKFDKADKSKNTSSGAKKKSGTMDRELGVQPLTKLDPGAGKQGKRASKIAKSKEGKKPPKEKNVIHGIKLGSKFQKHFEGHGTFVGTVVSYSKEKKYFSVKYTDGDTEELTTDDLRALMGMPPREKK